MGIYPWQQALWQRVLTMRSRMPHAILLQGRGGTGKLDFAKAWAAAWLCDQPAADGHACGRCGSCNWLAQGNHPDFRMLEPADVAAGESEEAPPAKTGKKSQIAVDQIRELADFLTLSSHRAGLRIVLLQPAEALNQASANALLKMLEEPPPGVLFLLVSSQPQRLLPTIRSRCSKIDMPLPGRDQAQQWMAQQGINDAAELLSYSGGAPLLAAQSDAAAVRRRGELFALLAQGARTDPFQAAAALVRDGMLESIDLLQKWGYDLLTLRLGGTARYQPAQAKSLQGLAEAVDLALLLDFMRKLTESRRYAQHPLNAELQLESLMLQYTQLFTVPAKT